MAHPPRNRAGASSTLFLQSA